MFQPLARDILGSFDRKETSAPLAEVFFCFLVFFMFCICPKEFNPKRGTQYAKAFNLKKRSIEAKFEVVPSTTLTYDGSTDRAILSGDAKDRLPSPGLVSNQ